MIYGFGSVYNSTDEKLPEFIKAGAAYIGWPADEAPALHQLLTKIGVGDIIFIKSFPPHSGLYIKAVGVVTSSRIFNDPKLGSGRQVRWVWSATGNHEPIHVGLLKDRYDNMRHGTLYEELGPEVQERVLEILFDGVSRE